MSRVLQILFVTAFLTLLCNPANAKHIKGGEIHYTYLGPSTTHPGWDLFNSAFAFSSAVSRATDRSMLKKPWPSTVIQMVLK